jgi:uncharacterized protein (TIRG00374 family)
MADGGQQAPGALAGHRVRNGLILAVTLSAVTIVAIMYATMNHSTWRIIGKIDPLFFVVALFLDGVKWSAACLRTNLLIRGAGSRLGGRKTVKAVIGGSFVGSVTPFQAGGIPTEIYFLYNYGIPAGKATAVVSTGAAMSTLLFIITMPIVLVVTASRIRVGFGVRTVLITAVVIAFFFFLAVVYSMREPEKVESWASSHAPAFLKKKENFGLWVERFSRAIADFSSSLREILGARKSILAGSVLLTLTFWASGFLIAPMILWGLGYPELFWTAMLAQLVVSCILPFLPVPGGSVFAESAFAGIFMLFVPRFLVGFVTLSWRFFVFYLMLIVQGIFFVLALRDSARTNHRQQYDEPDESAEPLTETD